MRLRRSPDPWRHHPLERVWCISIRSWLLLRWSELHISRLSSLCPHRRTPPTAPYIANTALRRSLLAVGTSIRDRAAILLQPSLRWRGILKPYSVPLGVIQDMCLADIYKGRGYSLAFPLLPHKVPSEAACRMGTPGQIGERLWATHQLVSMLNDI